MNNYDMQDYMHSPTDEDIEADSAGAFYKAGVDAERDRIVGLFDAASRAWDEELSGGTAVRPLLTRYQHIIEGLRK
jgi:hypothetical protein